MGYREAHPHVGETPECIARAAMERRLMAAARRHDREQMLDPELLTLFRAARQSRGNGRDRAHTVGRSNPSTLRPRITSRSFDDLCLLEVGVGTATFTSRRSEGRQTGT